MSIISYYQNGNIRKEEYFKNDKRHRDDDLPACIKYYENGNKETVHYYIEGKLHRELDLPSIIIYCEFGFKSMEIYCKQGKYHRENDLSSFTCYNVDGKKIIEEWNKNGRQYRVGYTENFLPKPSRVCYNENGEVIEYFISDEKILNSTQVTKYINAYYNIRKIIRKYKNKKREIMTNNFQNVKIFFENGIDVVKLICKFVI
jgi:hypothetical protein